MATSDPVAEIIGDYRAFAALQRDWDCTSTSGRFSSAMRARTERTCRSFFDVVADEGATFDGFVHVDD